MHHKTIGFIGGGRVTRIFLEGWKRARALPSKIVVSDGSADTLAKLTSLAMSVDGVHSIHDLRTRFVGASIQVDLHIVVDPDISVFKGHAIGDEVALRLKAEGPDVLDVLVHVDPGPDM